MKISIQQDRYFAATRRKAVMAFAVASLISGLFISPAFADRDNDEGRGRGAWNANQGQQHEWRGNRDRRYGHRPEYRRPYYYAQPVYVPPPVYYEPQQSPGISFFFPLDFRR